MKYYFLCLLMIVASSVFAQQNTHPVDVQYNTCLKEASGEVGKIACCQKAEKAWEAEINRCINLFNKEMHLDTKELMERASTAWNEYRQYEGEAIGDMFKVLNDEYYDALKARIKMNIVRSRALELYELYDGLHQP